MGTFESLLGRYTGSEKYFIFFFGIFAGTAGALDCFSAFATSNTTTNNGPMSALDAFEPCIGTTKDFYFTCSLQLLLHVLYHLTFSFRSAPWR